MAESDKEKFDGCVQAAMIVFILFVVAYIFVAIDQRLDRLERATFPAAAQSTK